MEKDFECLGEGEYSGLFLTENLWGKELGKKTE